MELMARRTATTQGTGKALTGIDSMQGQGGLTCSCVHGACGMPDGSAERNVSRSFRTFCALPSSASAKMSSKQENSPLARHFRFQ
eukprot:410182-Hanusia_phi.AAC.1